MSKSRRKRVKTLPKKELNQKEHLSSTTLTWKDFILIPKINGKYQ